MGFRNPVGPIAVGPDSGAEETPAGFVIYAGPGSGGVILLETYGLGMVAVNGALQFTGQLQWENDSTGNVWPIGQAVGGVDDFVTDANGDVIIALPRALDGIIPTTVVASIDAGGTFGTGNGCVCIHRNTTAVGSRWRIHDPAGAAFPIGLAVRLRWIALY